MGKLIQFKNNEVITIINIDDVRDQMFLVKEAYQILRDKNEINKATKYDLETLRCTVALLMVEANNLKE